MYTPSSNLPFVQQTEEITFVEVSVTAESQKNDSMSVEASMRPVAVIKLNIFQLLYQPKSQKICFHRFLGGFLMLEDAAEIRRVVLACGFIDLRKGIDSLSIIIGDKYNQNPFERGT